MFMACFFPKIFAVNFRRQVYEVFWPQLFSGGMIPKFLLQVVSAIYSLPFGWVPFAALRLRSLAMK